MEKPLCYIIYADKPKLSSFGSKMGYPVIAKLANDMRCTGMNVKVHKT